MNRYIITQLLSILAVFSAIIWWYIYPNNTLNAENNVELLMFLLQSIIVPNAFLSLLTAVLLIPASQLKKLAGCFFKSIFMLWGMVCGVLLILWFILAQVSIKTAFLPTFTPDKLWIVALVPLAMITAVVLGTSIVLYKRLHILIPYIQRVQETIASIFEFVFLLVPVLVFFVILRFLNYADIDMTGFVIHYFILAISLVLIMNVIIFPLIFRYLLSIPFSSYIPLVSPVVLMTFLAGDSIAAIPMIVHAADQYSGDNHSVTRIMALVVICFPWVGELSNLTFPIYTALLEQYNLTSVLSILSVGPFFMFTDPYISIPNLLGAFEFSEAYQVTYMTVALLTDHMFEVCESIAVLFVVLRLKQALFHNSHLHHSG